MQLDITKTPFSRAGSRLSLSLVPGEGLFLRCVRNHGQRSAIFMLTCANGGQPVQPDVQATSEAVRLTAPQGDAVLYLRGDDGLVIASRGLSIELQQRGPGFIVPESQTRTTLHYPGADLYTTIDVMEGIGVPDYSRYMHEDGIQRVQRTGLKLYPGDGRLLAHLTPMRVQGPLPVPVIDVAADLAAVVREWTAFRARLPTVPAERLEAAELAWYNLWSCTVRAEGKVAHDAVFMSKGHMCALWSWDHCFTALAMAYASPLAGLQQWLLPFALQQPTGQLPDRWSFEYGTWLATKPPIHGWCLQRFLERHPMAFETATLRKVYDHLERLTNWWFEYRDTDQDGICNYVNGLDSGWDNATLFDPDLCLEAADLSAFLVLDLHALADLATRLGLPDEAKVWRARAMDLLRRLRAHCWQDGHFVAKVSRTHTFDPQPTSLLALVPLVLGERLDRDIFDTLVARLEHDFLTPHGLATEMPASPLYLADGYWRGPIWAPSTYLIVDGLRRGGRGDLAREVARRFCDMVQQVGCNHENHDALTGAGLRDKGYTWTAAVNLLLMHEYLT